MIWRDNLSSAEKFAVQFTRDFSRLITIEHKGKNKIKTLEGGQSALLLSPETISIFFIISIRKRNVSEVKKSF